MSYGRGGQKDRPALFRGRHFAEEMIVLCGRWYLRFSLSYRDLEELMAERNLTVDHTTVWRWVQRYAPELATRASGMEANRCLLASGRDLHSRSRAVDVFVPGDRLGQRNDRFLPVAHARPRRWQSILPQVLDGHSSSPAGRD